ncbi:M61 family metallopeptidase [Parapusillimonas granuli]|uniref:M61 family metallopeptidase n=1 Tax=Parapusillimonas granuli TaxID=380911 RepID=A0A853G8D5_9BURK|nr:PDZ domain-containing protein [Parapusillimonas granuli]MBB5215736.1 putative metalloprotease with PDZ domain [Parapusillimonas granuli]NYT51200.1 M61 family metallopeptidase [Parapusillimonas granuli]
MKTEPILYSVTPFDPSGHRLAVVLSIPAPDPAGQALALPAWIPGSYLIRDFSRQVETISAASRGKPVQIRKTGSHRWLCEPADGPLTVEYTVYAWDLSVRGAHVDETHAFFNGTSVFLEAEGRGGEPCLVKLCPPPHTKKWRVHTSLPEAAGLPGAARRHGFGLYRASSYDDLIDHPVEMGTPQAVSFTAHGAEHEMVFTGVIPGLDLERIAADTKKICEAQIEFFEPEARKPPFLDSADRYVFMTMVTGNAYGGLEHRASTALMASRGDLPVAGRADAGEGYQTFLGLVSHEYFHTWNVKRIKPAAFAPYDLSRENHTRLLWVFEGFTSYYDDLMLLRSGVIQDTDYLRLLGKTISNVHGAGGRLKQSVAESSFDAWTRYYKQDENSPNALVSYYTKGALVALGLDLLIRERSGQQRCLDDVMRLMWRRFGRDFYRGAPVGVPEDAMPELILEATGVDAAEFIDRHAYGREDVPLEPMLAASGIRLEWKSASDAPSLDARMRAANGEFQFATVLEGGAAHAGGVSAGDVLVAVDGLRVADNAGLERLLRARRPGDVVQLHVFRRDELRAYSVRLNPPARGECVLTRSQVPA